MPALAAGRTRSVSLVLTSRCNLGCGYCFQNERKGGGMEWNTVRAAVDLVLGSGEETVEIAFFGGEPLLEFPLIRRVIEYVGSLPARKVTWGLTTNGILVTPEITDFLAAHRFDTQLSFDGVPAAQNVRGRGTFETLDRVLEDIRARHPRFYNENVRVGLTFTPATLRYLAESVAYFLGKGVRRITMGPVYTHAGTWEPERIHEMEDQFARILDDSVRHHQLSGLIPVECLRPPARSRRREEAGPMCGVGGGRDPVVDVDGTVHGCVTFAGSYQKFPSRFLEKRIRALELGNVTDSRLEARRASFPARVAATDIFSGKQGKRSSYGLCGECAFLAECGVCPVSIGHIPGNDDPDRVPDLLCAWSLVTLRCRREFAERTGASAAMTPEAYRRHVTLLRSIPRWPPPT